MPVLRPFRAVRYPPSRLSRLLCPPYDIIPPEQAARLRREPCNAVHLELPSGSGTRLGGDPAGYRRARALWERWLAQDTLRRDPVPALYVCEQEFRFGGRRNRRFGVFGDLSLGAGSRIVPHERTFSKPKADRLMLLQALGANTSPIFGIVEDPGARLLARLRAAAKAEPLAAARDPAGGTVRLWALSSGTLARSLASRPMLIADGHHRFQVSRDYARALGRDVGCLAYLCSDADPGLLLLPTHRVVTPAQRVWERIAGACRVERVGSRAALERRLAGAGARLGLFLNEERWVAQPRETAPLPRPSSRLREEGGLLAVEWLDRLLGAEPPERIEYTHEAAEAERLAERRGGLAVLLPAPSVGAVLRAVAARGLLPQKSTYFYPKVPTGLVFRELPCDAGHM